MNNIKRIREQRNLSQKQLAESVGVYQPTISRFEIGRRIPKSDVLAKIAKELDCTMDELIGEDQPS